uniref:Uncharacterized protein n=1 Tax=Romanomermis culicivorax TaxID=13658 RepID=A0A915JLE3_ROMCU
MRKYGCSACVSCVFFLRPSMDARLRCLRCAPYGRRKHTQTVHGLSAADIFFVEMLVVIRCK